jgi:hypothetical protein
MGDLTGCTFKSQLQTFEQRPTNQSPPGAAIRNAGSCYNFPTSVVTLEDQPQTFTDQVLRLHDRRDPRQPGPG